MNALRIKFYTVAVVIAFVAVHDLFSSDENESMFYNTVAMILSEHYEVELDKNSLEFGAIVDTPELWTTTVSIHGIGDIRLIIDNRNKFFLGISKEQVFVLFHGHAEDVLGNSLARKTWIYSYILGK